MFYLVSILLLALLDMIATHYQVEVYRTTDIEANPIMRWVMAKWGMDWAYAVRMISAYIGVVALCWCRFYSDVGLWALRLVLTIHVALAAYHLYITEFFTIHLG